MIVEEIKQSMKAEIASKNFTLQAVFDRHIEQIMEAKKQGYTYLRLFDLLDLNLHESHFRDLIYRSRKRRLGQYKPSNSKSEKSTYKEKNDVDIESRDHPNLNPVKSDLTLDDWIDHTNLLISKRQYKLLSELQIRPSDLDQNNITNLSKLDIYLTKEKHTKQYN